MEPHATSSTLIAQMWAQAMTKSFTFEAWDAWQIPLTRLLQSTALGPLDPCREAYLGLELRSWFLSHSPLAQHDAGEFMGWLREAMFRQKIRLAPWPFQGWEARLENNVEDRGTTLSPIVLRNLPPDHVQLQQLIHEWCASQPYVNELRSPCSAFNSNDTPH